MSLRLPLRLVAGCALGPAAAVLLLGCGAAAGTSGESTSADVAGAAVALTSFRNDFVSFRYPASWKRGLFGTSGTLNVRPVLYLSTQPGTDPCRMEGAGTVCGWPVRKLRPNGVLVVVENRGWPGWSLSSVKGALGQVGGRPARRAVARPGRCAAIGGDETVSVVIARPLPFNWTAVTACLRGPDLSARQRELEALLASTRFLAP